MKTIFSFWILFLCVTPLFAQPEITLPTYKKNEFRRDTLDSYYVSNDFNFFTGGSVEPEFITGVTFKILVDSLQFPGSSSANGETLHKGDLIPFPVSIKVFNGVIRARIILEGTPQIGGESYLCELAFFLLTGLDEGVTIANNSSTTCTVAFTAPIHDASTTLQPEFYPNPFHTATQLMFEPTSSDAHQLLVFNKQGQLILDETIVDTTVQLNKKDLGEGMYFYQLRTPQHIVSAGKIIVE